MAEFQEVARAYIRMCDSFGSTCTGCPINIRDNDIYVCRNKVLKNPEEYEADIMLWAAEHPVVYPTWSEWLMSIGVISGLFPKGAIDALGNLKQPIPADIAEKLGLRPKEM